MFLYYHTDMPLIYSMILGYSVYIDILVMNAPLLVSITGSMIILYCIVLYYSIFYYIKCINLPLCSLYCNLKKNKNVLFILLIIHLNDQFLVSTKMCVINSYKLLLKST